MAGNDNNPLLQNDTNPFKLGPQPQSLFDANPAQTPAGGQLIVDKNGYINDAISRIKKYGTASPSRFAIMIPSIPFASNFTSLTDSEVRDAGRILLFQCETAQFPSMAIDTSSFSPHGIPTHSPYGSKTDSVTLSFRCSENMVEKRLFDGWLGYIIDQWNSTISYRKDDSGGNKYKVPIRVMQLGRTVSVENLNESSALEDMTPVYEVTLENAFPVSVNSIELSSGDANAYHKIMVTFQFSYWYPSTGGLQPFQTGNKVEVPQQGLSERVLAAGGKFESLVTTPLDVLSSKKSFKNKLEVKAKEPSKLAKFIAQIDKLMKTVKGYLDLDQGETLNWYNKLDQLINDSLGIGINDFRRKIEQYQYDIEQISNADVLSSKNRSLLFGACVGTLNIIGVGG